MNTTAASMKTVPNHKGVAYEAARIFWVFFPSKKSGECDSMLGMAMVWHLLGRGSSCKVLLSAFIARERLEM
jgi:hypothetical protein